MAATVTKIDYLAKAAEAAVFRTRLPPVFVSFMPSPPVFLVFPAAVCRSCLTKSKVRAKTAILGSKNNV